MAGKPSRDNFRSTTGGPQGTRTRSHVTREPRHSEKALLVERNKYDGLSARPIAYVSIPRDDQGSEEITIKNCKCIGSYSWADAGWTTPTILVPGLPRKLGDKLELPYKVPAPDRGIHIIDQNGFRTTRGNIDYFVPFICSVLQYQKAQEGPSFDWASVDVVTDRAALRKLSRWVNGKLSTRKTNYESDTNFRLDVQLVGKKTLLFNRRSLRFAEQLSGHTYRKGFGEGFTNYPDTFRDAKALDYYRIMHYDMNGMNMVVRFEVDAYCSTTGSGDEDVKNLLTSLSLSSSGSSTTSNMYGLRIQEWGQKIASSDVIELSTRSVKNYKPLDWTGIYTQLSLSQTPKYIVARHEDGLFTDIREWSLADQELDAARMEGQKHMTKLCQLLTFIRNLAMPYLEKNPRLSVVCDHGELKLYQRDGQGSNLPDDLLELFNKNGEVIQE